MKKEKLEELRKSNPTFMAKYFTGHLNRKSENELVGDDSNALEASKIPVRDDELRAGEFELESFETSPREVAPDNTGDDALQVSECDSDRSLD